MVGFFAGRKVTHRYLLLPYHILLLENNGGFPIPRKPTFFKIKLHIFCNGGLLLIKYEAVHLIPNTHQLKRKKLLLYILVGCSICGPKFHSV